MENFRPETLPSAASLQEAYEQNRTTLLDLMGRINGLLASNYRTERPRSWEHVGKQEEVIAMLQSVADYLEA